MGDLRIRSMRNRYRLGAQAQAGALRAGLDALATRQLPALLERRLADLPARLGLPADALVMVRRLNLRLHLDGLAANPSAADLARVADCWSEALVAGLERVLGGADIAPGDGLQTDLVAIFADTASARRILLPILVRDGVGPWWARLLPGATGQAGTVLDCLVTLADDDGPAAAQAIVATVEALGTAWLDRLDEVACRRISRSLLRPQPAARGSRPDRQNPLQAAPAGGTLAGELPASPRRDIRCRRPAAAALLLCARAVEAGQTPRFDDYEAAVARFGGRMALPAGVDDDSPAAAGASPSTEPVADRLQRAGAAGEAETGPTAGAQPMPERVVETAAAGHAEPGPGDDRRVAETAPLAGHGPGLPVGCAGLLFLLRPTLALLASQAPLRPVLLALCGGLLDELFERLSPASRRAAWLREAPLVQVFAGLDEPPAEPAALTADRTAVAQASRVLERLQARLDPAVAAAPRACAYVLGVDEAPLTALQRLLLRTGRMWVGPHHATLRLPAVAIDLAVRRGGWDVDPGWQPRIGRVVRFEYLAS